jgi:hypothetical protein
MAEEAEEREIHHADGRIERPGIRYEPKDVSFGWLLVVLLVGIGILGVISYTIWHFYWFQESALEESGKSPYPLAPAPLMQLPPEPRLEQLNRMAGVERSNVFKRQLAKEKVLHGYGPTAEKGFVHVPIQHAMKVLAAKSQAGQLPESKPRPPAARDQGLLDAGESNSGRMFRKGSP